MEQMYSDIYPPITAEALSRIPASMKAVPRWIVWGGNKIPVNGHIQSPRGYIGADITKETSWMAYEDAVKLIGKECTVNGESFHVSGIGFVVGDGWFCLDMDGGEKHRKEPVPESAVKDAMAHLKTYAEVSLSGCGYHLFGFSRELTIDKGQYQPESFKPHKREDSYEIEMFARRKFIAMTGNVLDGSASGPAECGVAAAEYYKSHILEPWQEQEKERIAAIPRLKPPVNADDATQMFLNCYREILRVTDSSNYKRNQWVGLVKAMREISIPFVDVLEWCRRGSNFKDERDVEKVWNEQRGAKNRPASVAALVHEAKLNGWNPTPDQLTGEFKVAHDAAKARTDSKFLQGGSPIDTIDPETGEILQPVSTAPTPDEKQPIPGKTIITASPAQADKKNAVPDLVTFNADYFNNTDIPEPEPIIDKILYPGLGMLGAPAKMGKTYMVLQLGCCVAAGRPFMGFEVLRPGPVLYLDLQGTMARTKKRLHDIGYQEMPQGLSVAYKTRTTDSGLVEQLERWISVQPQPPVLIIIDMLQQIKGAQRRTEDAYTADNRILEPLHDFAMKHRLAVFCVMHTRKGNKILPGEDPFNVILGSIGQFGSADCSWMIIGRRTDDRKRFSVICRDNDVGQVDYEATFQNHRWCIAGTVEDCEEQREALRYNQNPIVFTIRKLVEESPSGWIGKMSDLMQEVAVRTNQYPADTPVKMQRLLNSVEYRLHCEGILVERMSPNGGKNGRRYRISKYQPEQQSIDC